MATVNGTNTGDTLYGTSDADTIKGLGGDDTIKGMGGADYIDGGSGIDTAFYSDSTVGVGVNLMTGTGFGGTAEGDTLVSIENLTGSLSGDGLIGNDADNRLAGLNGNDILIGGAGTNTLDGGAGDDTLKGGGGFDFLIGGDGNDTANFDAAALAAPHIGVDASLATGEVFQAFHGLPTHLIATLSGIENLDGTSNRDSLTGDDGVNVLRGFGGEDFLAGGAGNDTLDGGAGNDTLDGGAGNDTLDGGGGNDWFFGGHGADHMYGGAGLDAYYVDQPGDVVIEYAGEGYDFVLTSVSYALQAGSEIEALYASFAQDTTMPISLTGNEFGNFIVGDNANDVLSGGAGNDKLLGLGGADTLIGGSGVDVFLWRDTAESGLTAATFDVIMDFNITEGDKIDVSEIDADETVAGNQAFTFIGATPPPYSGPAQIRYGTDGVDTFIVMNTDADPTDNDFVIRVAGVHTVDESWFVL